MKYVIFKGNGRLHPVLFSDHTTHAQAYDTSEAEEKEITSGFVTNPDKLCT